MEDGGADPKQRPAFSKPEGVITEAVVDVKVGWNGFDSPFDDLAVKGALVTRCCDSVFSGEQFQGSFRFNFTPVLA